MNRIKQYLLGMSRRERCLLVVATLSSAAFLTAAGWMLTRSGEKIPAASQRMELDNRAIYVGEIQDGKPHGFGKLTAPDGYVYMGGWYHGEKSGSGAEWKPDGEKYIGQFKSGWRHGTGVIYYPDGTSYAGDIRMDRLEGYGTRHYQGNDKFVGYWKDNYREKRGVLYRNGQLSYGIFSKGQLQRSLQPEGMDRVYGIDLSHYNEAIPWHDLAVNVDKYGVYHARPTDGYSAPLAFCYVKATEGSDVRDEMFDEYFEKALHAFYVRGAYHIFSSQSSPKDQARNYINTVQLRRGDLPPILDIEKVTAEKMGREALLKGVRQWIDIVEKHYGVRPIIYVSDLVKRDYLDTPSLHSYHYIIARYVADPARMHSKEWTIWQFSEHGRVGVRPNPYLSQVDIDINMYQGSFSQFCRFVENVSLKK